jgi:hypothetical protein
VYGILVVTDRVETTVVGTSTIISETEIVVAVVVSVSVVELVSVTVDKLT